MCYCERKKLQTFRVGLLRPLHTRVPERSYLLSFSVYENYFLYISG